MMRRIDDIPSLDALYATPGEISLRKVTNYLTTAYADWIAASRFCVLSTVGPEGTDASPRGDDGPVVAMLDARRLALPDWRGNQRLDSLRNIVRDDRVSLMFFVRGSTNVMRVNGTGFVTDDADLREQFARVRILPATVIVVTVEEVYSQCARALIRAGLWAQNDDSNGLPTVGQMMAEITNGEEGGTPYDDAWAARAAKTMW